MGDPWIRLTALVVVGLVALSVVALSRRRTRRRPERDLPSTGLSAGVYLLTSAGCSTCDGARSRLEGAGKGAYIEISWEADPEFFERLDIDAVPALLVVGESGSGRLHPGATPAAIATL